LVFGNNFVMADKITNHIKFTLTSKKSMIGAFGF
jgi:hypothetical protein